MTYSGEINFDGLIGPTHNYGGLSEGNFASKKHNNQTYSKQQQSDKKYWSQYNIGKSIKLIGVD